MRILFISGKQENTGYIKQNLESECFVVEITSDEKQGIVRAQRGEYVVVILDDISPATKNSTICQTIRNEGKETPIMVLSSVSDTQHKVDILNAGADDYIVKPYALQELTARIRALLRRPLSLKEEIIIVGDLMLDSKRHKVCKGKKEVYLTRKEFMLLEYLMTNKESVLSRGMIMEHVWDMNADPFSNTIESHMRSLRKKVDYTHTKLIHTIPGRGYKIEVL